MINVVDCGNGLGLIDFKNNTSISPVYDNVKIELKVTLENEIEKRQRIFSIANGEFKKGKIMPFEEW